MPEPVAILHLDESCLGNGRDRSTPGGGGGLVEVRTRGGIQRRDFYLAHPNTTNNRMALEGATMALRLLSQKGRRLKVLMVSDSEYLVKGMRDWMPRWMARGWRKPGGPIENLPLWRSLADAAALHDVQWTWVRGHRGHPKNEYANDLAVAAAEDGESSDGAVPSEFLPWLEERQARGLFAGYDADAAFAALERRMKSGERISLALTEEGAVPR
ncbi:MAG TPA: ribonuclease H [Gemmatimonadales bacterium]|nr:ribonuclease H [Gemmatimonadales bacterium]